MTDSWPLLSADQGVTAELCPFRHTVILDLKLQSCSYARIRPLNLWLLVFILVPDIQNWERNAYTTATHIYHCTRCCFVNMIFFWLRRMLDDSAFSHFERARGDLCVHAFFRWQSCVHPPFCVPVWRTCACVAHMCLCGTCNGAPLAGCWRTVTNLSLGPTHLGFPGCMTARPMG